MAIALVAAVVVLLVVTVNVEVVMVTVSVLQGPEETKLSLYLGMILIGWNLNYQV